MKLILVFSISLFFNMTFGQSSNLQYDSILARKLGADDYGMKKYSLVILKTGKGDMPKDQLNEIFRGHLDNIYKMAKNGQLVIAGPISKNPLEYRGIYVFNITDRKLIEELLQTDPAIATKILEPEIFEWYASAALPTFLENHDKIEKLKH